MRRYTAFLCCDLAALSPAAAARLYISSVLPLKISNRRRQGETHSGTAIMAGGSCRTGGPQYQGARCTCPGGAGPPRMGASAVHPRAGQVRRRPGNGAADGADQGELAPGDDQRAPPVTCAAA
jgi:hypothetical protein